MGGEYVLFNAASETIYELDDQTKPEGFAGKKGERNRYAR